MEQMERLKEEHRRLIALARRLAWVVALDCPPLAQDLYPLRQEFTSAVICHLKLEDWLIYPRLISSSNEKLSQTAMIFSEEMGGLGELFRGYFKRWGAIAVDADWKGYGTASSLLVDALEQRIEREEADLFPLCSHLTPTVSQCSS